jgi:hypothetical protein
VTGVLTCALPLFGEIKNDFYETMF